jgi:hypothetical protein
MTYTPTATPLIPGYATTATQACVIIPARNEEDILPRTLDALRLQHDLCGDRLPYDWYEVILFLNNCTDASQAVAERYQQDYPGFHLHIAIRRLEPEVAHVGMARRLLMDTAYNRLQRTTTAYPAILSTDADTVVAPDWIARNLAAIQAGADAVGGVINLFSDDLAALRHHNPGTYTAYQHDHRLQALVARLESLLDPDPHDSWPRHLQHFGASLACTTSIYALAGGLPPVSPLEDVAFVDALRKVGASIRHCPYTHIFTSARLDGRAQVGLSGQLTIWQQQHQHHEPHTVDSAQWMEHRFRSLAALRRINDSESSPSLDHYPASWQSRIATLHRDCRPTPRFLELLDCNTLIEEMFLHTGHPRHAEITDVIAALTKIINRSLSNDGRHDDRDQHSRPSSLSVPDISV